jgi:hypothetical protein
MADIVLTDLNVFDITAGGRERHRVRKGEGRASAVSLRLLKLSQFGWN